MTSFKEYLDYAWVTHKTEAKSVAEEFKSKFNLMETEDDVMSMAGLIVHVCGEHLGNWEQGIDLLKKLKNNAPIKDKEQMKRFVAIMNLGNNPNISISEFSPSDQVIIFSDTASALAKLGGLKNTEKLFSKALEYASDLTKEDPAYKALAIAGNSIAKSLEAKELRKPDEVDLMILAAQTAKKYWNIAGTWMEVQRAEYRLSQTYLKAEQADKSLEHAQKCLSIINENGDIPLELFFAYEALVSANKVTNNEIGLKGSIYGMEMAFDKLSEADRGRCNEILEKMTKE
jgi:tetratricopeptide (TPR) repeat protein